MTAIVITTLVLSFVAFLFARRYDPDPGGYVDSFRTAADFPDKAIHAAYGALLCFALAIAMPIEYAVLAVAVIGAAYELGQGFFSWYDLLADVLGALTVWAYLALLGALHVID